MTRDKATRPTGALGRALDPVVQQELARQEQAEKRRQMTPAQRRRAAADAKRSKATYDLPSELVEALRQIAAKEDVSISDVAAEFLIRAVNDYLAGTLSLHGQKRPTRSLRVGWKLELSELNAGNDASVRPA